MLASNLGSIGSEYLKGSREQGWCSPSHPASLQQCFHHFNTCYLFLNGVGSVPWFNSDTPDVLAQLAGVAESIAVIQEKVETYAEYQRLFEIPVSEWTTQDGVTDRTMTAPAST